MYIYEVFYISLQNTIGGNTYVCHIDKVICEFMFCNMVELSEFGKGKKKLKDKRRKKKCLKSNFLIKKKKSFLKCYGRI